MMRDQIARRLCNVVLATVATREYRRSVDKAIRTSLTVVDLHTSIERVLLDHADELDDQHGKVDANLAELANVYRRLTGFDLKAAVGEHLADAEMRNRVLVDEVERLSDHQAAATGRLRTGRTVGRTIYRQISDDPSKNDELIGLMDTKELASLVVEAVNRHQEKTQ